MSNAVVYVHLQNDIPRCFWTSIKKVRKGWDGRVIYIGPRREMDHAWLKKYNVEFIPEDTFSDDTKIREYEEYTFFNKLHPGWNGFWDNACKRLIYLGLIDVDEWIHLETDVVPYANVSKMFDAFKSVYKNKIIFSKHAPYQVSCCTIYCNDKRNIKAFNNDIIEYFKGGDTWFYARMTEPKQTILNETHFAWRFCSENPVLHDWFPTMPGDRYSSDIGFLIDPTAYGMWVNGRQRYPNEPFASDAHFVGKMLLAGKLDIAWHSMIPYVETIQRVPTGIRGEGVPLATVHFNSKMPEAWV